MPPWNPCTPHGRRWQAGLRARPCGSPAFPRLPGGAAVAIRATLEGLTVAGAAAAFAPDSFRRGTVFPFHPLRLSRRAPATAILPSRGRCREAPRRALGISASQYVRSSDMPLLRQCVRRPRNPTTPDRRSSAPPSAGDGARARKGKVELLPCAALDARAR